MNDPIDRQAAIDALGKKPLAWTKGEYEHGLQDQWERDVDALMEMPSAQQWIPCTPETMPENEQDILVTVEVRLFGRKPYRRVVRAFYTDGKHTDADSAYSWSDFPNSQYDDKDNLIIPEGWWESSDYYEQQGMVDDFVVAWMPLPEPYREDAYD